jgi:hypothetical protein
MQKLIFNTEQKIVEFYSGEDYSSFTKIQTVSIREQGFYELMQLQEDNVIRPIFRAPICNTNMFLIHK